MKKTKPYKLFLLYFGLGLLVSFVFACTTWLIAGAQADAQLKEIEKKYKNKKRIEHLTIENIENKQFINMATRKQHIFHKDTLYFLFFPHWQSKKNKLEAVEIEKMAVSQVNKPFRLMYAAYQSEEKDLREWANKTKVSLKNCYLTNELKFCSLKCVLYQNKERFSTVDAVLWNHQEIKDFFQKLYNKK